MYLDYFFVEEINGNNYGKAAKFNLSIDEG